MIYQKLGGAGELLIVGLLNTCIGGALTLSGRYTPLGLLILGPIVVNIALFNVFLEKALNPVALAAAVFSLFLLYAYRKSFLPILCLGKHPES